MDPLRQNIKKLLDSVESPILEKDDIIEILDGRVDGVITKHRHEDEVFSQTIAEIKPEKKITTTPRLDMEEDGIIDVQQYTREMAQQIITSFEQTYDEVALKNIQDLRSKKSHKSKREVRDYDETLAIVLKLKKQFDIK